MARYYSKEHEWIDVEGTVATVGVTEYAVKQLGDITFFELPEVDAEVEKESGAAFVESVKAASDIYAPVTGKIVEVNEALEDTPEIANESPEENAWIFKIDMSDPSELEGLMDRAAYDAFLETL